MNMSSSTLEEYYPAIAIATLMRIIRDPTLSQHHTMVVQVIRVDIGFAECFNLLYKIQIFPSNFAFVTWGHIILIKEQNTELEQMCATSSTKD